MSDLPDSATLFGPGKVFAEGREALGLSRAQLADILNLPVRTILAIEENNPSVLPDAVYVNGYMRSYPSCWIGVPTPDRCGGRNMLRTKSKERLKHETTKSLKILSRPAVQNGAMGSGRSFLAVGFVYFVTNSDQQAVTDEAGSQASDSDVSRQAMLACSRDGCQPRGVSKQAIQVASAPETAVWVTTPDTQPKADGDALNVRERTVVEPAAEPAKVETQVVEAERMV